MIYKFGTREGLDFSNKLINPSLNTAECDQKKCYKCGKREIIIDPLKIYQKVYITRCVEYLGIPRKKRMDCINDKNHLVTFCVNCYANCMTEDCNECDIACNK